MNTEESTPVKESGIEKIFKDLAEIGKDYYDLTTGEIVRVIPVDCNKYADRIKPVFKDEDGSWFPSGTPEYINYILALPEKEINLEWYRHIVQQGQVASFMNSWGFNSDLFTLVSEVRPNPETGIFTIKCGACGSKNVVCSNLEIKCQICGNRKALV